MHPHGPCHIRYPQPLGVSIVHQVPGLTEPVRRLSGGPGLAHVTQPGHERQQFEHQPFDGEGRHRVGVA
jgi:hypothetical protein